MTLALALDDAGFWTLIMQSVGVVTLVLVGSLWLGGAMWVAADVRRRTTDPAMQWLSVLAAVLLFVPGIILYVAIRPNETLQERSERQWEMELLAQQAQSVPFCGACQRRLRDDFVRCPYCAATVGESCAKCSRFNALEWVVCPYCGDSRTIGAAAPARKRAASRSNGHVPAVATAIPIATNGRTHIA